MACNNISCWYVVYNFSLTPQDIFSLSLTKIFRARDIIIIVIIILIYIFPEFLAQRCNYATLLAGRCGNNLWYSVIFPIYEPFFRCSYSVSEFTGSSVLGVFIFLDFTLLLGQLWACPSSVRCLFLGVAACIGLKWFAMVLLCALCRGRFGLLLLVSVRSTVSNSLLLLHMSTPLPVHRMRMHSVPNGGSIAEGFRRSTIRMGCFVIHS